MFHSYTEIEQRISTPKPEEYTEIEQRIYRELQQYVWCVFSGHSRDLASLYCRYT